MKGLAFAREWLAKVDAAALADVAARFDKLLFRVRDELRARGEIEGGHVGKATAGACLVVALKVEDGECPPLDGLCAVLGVSKRALVKWEARVLELLDWNLELATPPTEPPPSTAWLSATGGAPLEALLRAAARSPRPEPPAH